MAALAAAVGFLFQESLFGGRGLVPADGVMSFPPWQETKIPSNLLLSDQFLVFLPQHEFVHQQFQQGHFPLWNPCLDCGVPNLGSVQGALLFPINLLLLPLSPFYASGIAAFLKLVLAGWFMMLYLRQLGVSNSGAFVSGLAFSLSGYMIVWLGHPHTNSAMFLPLYFYFIERFFQAVRRRTPIWGSCLGLAITCGCTFLGGHPPTMVQMAVVIGCYLLVRWWQHRREPMLRPVGFLAAAVITGFLLAAPAILPFLEYDHYSSEVASSNNLHRSASSLSVKFLLFYLLPHGSGSPTVGWGTTFSDLGLGQGISNFNEHTGYVGVLPLLFALCAVVQRRCFWTRFFGISVLVYVLFIVGTPPLPSLFGLVPVLNNTSPMRLLLMVGFGLAVLAGLGWDSFWRSASIRLKYCCVAAFWIVVAAVLLGCGWVAAPHWHVLEPGAKSYLWLQLYMLAGSLVVSGLFFVPSISRPGGLAPAVVLLWIVADLLLFAWGYNPAIPRDRYYPDTPAIEWLQQRAGHSRFIGDRSMLVPNAPEVFALRDVRGWDFTTVRRYEELINGQAGDFSFYNYVSSLPPAMQLLGVRYFVAVNQPNPDPSQFETVYSNDVTIFRYLPARERALVVSDFQVEPDPAAVLKQVRSGIFDPQRTLLLEEKPEQALPPPPGSAATNSVRFVADEADTVSVEADLSQPGFLLLLDTYFPGWTATVNGQPTKIYRADYNFRAVQLPAGKSAVSFSYQPRSFRWGLGLGAIGWLLLAAGFWRLRRCGTARARASPKYP